MASLTGNKIKDSYLGLLKSIDNIDFVPRGAGVFVQISDGDGNGLPLYLSTAGIRFHNAYTFPSATGTVGQVLSADAAGDLVFSDQLDNQTLEQVLTRGNTTTLAILSTASGNTFGSTTFSGIATLANASKVLGTPPTANDSSTNIATTAYVDNQVNTGGTVKKTGTIAQNAIAVWNNTSDTLRSDDTISVLTDGTITLTQEDTTGAAQKNYNIGGGNIALNTGNFNTGFGKDNLNKVAFTTGGFNNAFGYNTLFSMTTGVDNSAFGANALYSETTGDGNIAIGGYSMYNSENVYFSIAIGIKALYSNTTGTQNIALGFESLYTNVSGDANTSLGYRALKANLGDRNIAVGYNSGISMTTGDNNVILGSFSGVRAAAPSVLAYDISASNNNIVISDGIGNVFQSFDSTGKTRLHNYGGGTFTGTVAKTLGVDSSGNIIEVDTVTVSGTPVANQIAIWTNATTIKGVSALEIATDGTITLSQPNSTPSITLSYNIGGGNIANVTGLNNTGFGLDNLSSLTTGTQNVAIGKSALGDNTEGLSNVSVGYLSLTSNTTGNSNIAIGVQSLQANTYASNNVSIGQSALILNVSGANNTAIGNLSLGANTANSNSTSVGYLSLRNSTGANNTAIGKDSGSAITTGSNNVIIGSNTASTIATSDNNIIISDGGGNIRQSFDSNGNATFAGKVGMNVAPASTRTLLVKGQGTSESTAPFQVNDGSNADILVIKDDKTATFSGDVKVNEVNPLIFVDSTSTNKASGIITSQSGTNKWAIGTNFGSSDDSFNIYNYTAASRYLTISSTGNVGIGVSPATKLHIRGTSASTDSTLQIVGNGVSTLLLGQNARGGVIRGQGGSNELAFFVGGVGDTAAEIGTETMRIASTGLTTFQGSVQEKIKLIASSDEYLSLAFANNSGTTQWEISKGNSNELYFYRGGGGVDQAIKLNISSTGLAKFTPTGGNLSGAVNALHLKNTGTAAGDGTVILFTAGASSDGAAIKSTGRIFNGSDLTFFTGGSAAANARLTISTGGEITVKKSITTEGLITDSSFPIYKSKLSGAYTGGWGSLAVGTVLGGLQHSHVRTDGGQVNIAAAIDFLLANNTYGTGQSEISFKCGGVNGVDSTEKVRITSGGVLQIFGTSTANALSISHDGGNNVTMSTPYLNGNQDFKIINSSAGVLLDYAATSWTSNSDENIKENIISLNNVLDKIKDIRCVNYNLKDEAIYKKRLGFIAQDFQEDFAEVVNENSEGILGLRYTETIPILMKAIQEQQTIIEDLKSRIETLGG